MRYDGSPSRLKELTPGIFWHQPLATMEGSLDGPTPI
jgi:hypothetical protein